jgi:hypothetical protein
MTKRRALSVAVPQTRYTSPLYDLVYRSWYSKIIAFAMLAFFLLQPALMAEASEGEIIPTSDEVNNSTSDIAGEVLQNEIEKEMSAVAEENPPPVFEESSTSTITPTVTTEGNTVSVSDEPQTDLDNETILPTETSTTTNEVSDSTQTPVINTDIEQVNIDSATSSDQTVPEVLPETILDLSSSTEEEIVPNTATTSVIETIPVENEVIVEHSSHAFEFGLEECAGVGDGSFYCSKADKAPVSKPDGVFSAPDSDGDMEIYVRVNNEEQQLTFNKYDDKSPYYDALSERIVWHADINDRYQIISYDLNSNEQKKITDTPYNNMEPVAYGDITLWQTWLNNNWEIMKLEGSELSQLTSNNFNDISPHMRDQYVIWQSQFSDGWKVTLFDERTGKIEYLNAEAGTKLENPRFVLVYDSTTEAGDTQTIGYDPNKKVSFALGSLPAQLPEELPEPDQTGETRALIQAKPSVRGGDIEESTAPQPTSTPPTISPNSHLTLDLSTTSTPANTNLNAATSSSFGDVSMAPNSNIPDLVIPPKNSTTTQ